MEITNRFLTLMVRKDNLSEDEKVYIKTVYQRIGYEQVYEAVKKRRIIPFAAATLLTLKLDATLWETLLEEYRQRNQDILAFLNAAYTALAQHGVKRMFVSENFGALLSSGADIGLFSSGDVDNFAPLEEKENIYAAMESIGCKIHERFSGKNQIASEFYPNQKFQLPEKFYLSVDYYPLARLKLPCFICADDFIDWDGMSHYADTNINLAPPDALMYICLLHISLHSFCRAPDIRLYIDILNMSKCNIDYEKIAGWCSAAKTQIRVAVSASISNKLMKTQLPNTVAKSGKRTSRIARLVYDAKKQCLKLEPGRWKVLKLEMMCDGRSDFAGLGSMIFPDKLWMKKTYGSSGVVAHLKHMRRML